MVQARLLSPHLDPWLAPRGFERRTEFPRYHRKLGASRQTIDVVLDRRHRGDALAVVYPWLQVAMPRIDRVLKTMAGDMPARPTATLRQPVEFTSGDQAPGHWDLMRIEDIPAIAAAVGHYFEAWTLPFLDEYHREVDVVRSVLSRDERVMRDHNQILRAVAATFLEQGPTMATQLLEEHFDTKTLRARYAPFFAYLNRKKLN